MTTLYAAMESELLVIEGRNGGWWATSRLSGRRPQCLAVDPERPERLYCGTFGEGLYKSEDGGGSWEPAGEGVSYSEVMAVAVGPDGSVFAGTEPSALFRSEDGAKSWRKLSGLNELPSSRKWSFPPRPHTHHVRWIEPDPYEPGRLYVCIEAGALVRSFDGGESWEDREPDGPYDTHTLATHPKAPGLLRSAAGDGYFESHNGGGSWEQPEEGLSHRYLWGMGWTLTSRTRRSSRPLADPGRRIAHRARSRPSTAAAATSHGSSAMRGCPSRRALSHPFWRPAPPRREHSTP
jgi:photosystem II stability/assembly factor-like uncharacterized protein